MIIHDAFNSFFVKLKNNNISEPCIKCSIIFCMILNMDKAQLFAHMDDVIYDKDLAAISSKVALLLNDVPVQHITGHQEFMSLDFHVSPDVLIPRQDTEILVDTVISAIKKNNITTPHILELGTGSGCISVSLAHYVADSKIIAADISKAALSIAHKNASINNVADRIQFIHGDILLESFYSDCLTSSTESLYTGCLTPTESLYTGCLTSTENLYTDSMTPHDYSNSFNLTEPNDSFDIVVSNPPYIPTAEVQKLDKNVCNYEPHLALDGGPDGLNFYKAIAKFAPRVLKEKGFIFLEAGYDTILPAAEILSKSFEDIQIIKDINGINRVLLIIK
jgi:release factor glutamine methyltransferase